MKHATILRILGNFECKFPENLNFLPFTAPCLHFTKESVFEPPQGEMNKTGMWEIAVRRGEMGEQLGKLDDEKQCDQADLRDATASYN